MTMKIARLVKPKGKTWDKASRYSVNLYEPKFPICGNHLVFASIGIKWVRVTKGDMLLNRQRQKLSRFKMSLKQWEQTKPRRFG